MFPITINHSTDALIIVDLQPDFMEGGPLAVNGGQSLIEPINEVIPLFRTVVATQDWHPANHSSFASQWPTAAPLDTVEMPYGRQTLWPDHCIQNTRGAELAPNLSIHRITHIVQKGFRQQVDSYSGFFENDRQTPTGLDVWLRERGVTRIFLCGLATDFCVGYSALDAATLGYTTIVLEDLSRGIGIPLPSGQTTIDAMKEETSKRGVIWTSSKGLY